MLKIDLLRVALLVAMALVVFVPIALMVYGIVKKKRKLTITTFVLTVLCLTGVVLYNVIFPTHYPYVDRWITGKSREEVIVKYGEPDFTGDTSIAYYAEEDDGFFGVMDSNVPYYYYIYFDEDGHAYKMEKAKQPGG